MYIVVYFRNYFEKLIYYIEVLNKYSNNYFEIKVLRRKIF